MSQLRLVTVPWLLLAPVRQTLRDCPSPPRAARLWPGTHRPGRCSLRSHALGCGRGVAGTSCRCALGPGPGGGLLSLFPHERTVLTAAVVHGTRGAQAVTRVTCRGPPDPSWPLPPGTGLRDESRRRARAASLSPRPGQGAGVSLGGAGGPGVPALSVASSRKVPVFGLEAIWRDGRVVGHTRRAGFGFAIDKSIAYGYVRDPSGGLVSPVPGPAKGGPRPSASGRAGRGAVSLGTVGVCSCIFFLKEPDFASSRLFLVRKRLWAGRAPSALGQGPRSLQGALGRLQGGRGPGLGCS